MTKPIKILLDLDGVLITNPAWKPDEMASDGYSKFNEKCVRHFNIFIEQVELYEIWLSSSRRAVMSLREFNTIFVNRGVKASITGFTPFHGSISRRTEIETFAEGLNEKELLIIDDDSSLQDLPQRLKERWIATNLFQGFTAKSMEHALNLLD